MGRSGANVTNARSCGLPSDRAGDFGETGDHDREKDIRPDLRLEFIAYQLAITPPEHVKTDKDILVDFCPISQEFDKQIDDASSSLEQEAG